MSFPISPSSLNDGVFKINSLYSPRRHEVHEEIKYGKAIRKNTPPTVTVAADSQIIR
jgi:hypothetical protein